MEERLYDWKFYIYVNSRFTEDEIMKQWLRFLTIYSICALLVFSLIPSIMENIKAEDDPNESRFYSLPSWNPGDWWVWQIYTDEDETLLIMGATITIEEMVEDRTEIVQFQETVRVNGTSYDVYNVTVVNDMEQSGTWSFMGNDGDYSDRSQSVGYAYYRRSDLALIKEVLDTEGRINIEGITSTGYTATLIRTANPPLDNFHFPMAPTNHWTVNSIVVNDATYTQEGGSPEKEVLVETHNYVNTVGLEESSTVAGVPVDYYPIHSIGTVTVQGIGSPVNTFINYSSQVKNSINNLTDFGDIDEQMSDDVDLRVTVSDVSIIPQSPRQGTPVQASFEFQNSGSAPVIRTEVEASLTGGDFSNTTSYVSILGGDTISSVMDLGVLEPGGYQFRVSLDPENGIDETSENNNIAVYSFTVSANHAPTINDYEPLFDPTINEGNTITFEINATDAEGDDLFYQWSVDGMVVASENSSEFEKDFTGAQEGHVYVIKGIVIDELGGNSSQEWQVTINSAPIITSHNPSTDTFTVNEGEEVGFNITIENPGDDLVYFEWYVDGRFIPTVKSAFFTFKSTFNDDNSSEGSPYEIMVIVEDALGLKSEFTWTLTVKDLNQAPTISVAMAAGQVNREPLINETEFIQFEIMAVDSDGDVLTYAWFVNEVQVPGSTGTSHIFNTDHSTVMHIGGALKEIFVIKVNVKDGESNISYTWTLTVMDKNRPLRITIDQPVESALGALTEDDPVDFSATGVDPDEDTLSYEWFLDGVAMGVNWSFDYTFEAGNHTIKLIGTDGYGSRDVQYINFTVLPSKTDDRKDGSDSEKKGGSGYIVIIIVIILVLVGTLALYLLMKRRTGKKNIVTFTKETGKSVENYIFLCPKCNEKADEDLGYCIDCGATFDEQ